MATVSLGDPTVPVPPSERIELLDALRGFALFGVVTSNTLGGSGFNPALHPEQLAAPLDRQVVAALGILITGKFMGLFTLLFGVGFGLQLARANAQSVRFAPRYLWRMAALFAIGMLHYVLLSGGSLLQTYAIFGVVLILFRNASDRTLLLAAGLALFLPVLARGVVDLVGYQRLPVEDAAHVTRVLAEGPYLERTRILLRDLPRQWWVLVMFNSSYLALFLLGFYAARRRILEAPASHLKLLRGVCAGGLIITLALHLAGPSLQHGLADSSALWQRAIPFAVGSVKALGLILAYGAGFALVWHVGARTRGVLSPLRYSGRMALTNFLSVSVLCDIVFFGLGLSGVLRPSVAVALGVLLWCVQLLWSRWWLRRFRFGPAEWLWRIMTYGRA